MGIIININVSICIEVTPSHCCMDLMLVPELGILLIIS